MENKLFEYASSCYEKAGDEVGMLRAMAYDLYQRAVGAGGRDALAPAQPLSAAARRDYLLRAARCFAQLPDGCLLAARCCREAGEHQLAAAAFRALGKPAKAAKALAAAAETAATSGGGHDEAKKLAAEAAAAWEEAGKPMAAMLTRLAQPSLVSSALAMLRRPPYDTRTDMMATALRTLEKRKAYDDAIRVCEMLEAAAADATPWVERRDELARKAANAHAVDARAALAAKDGAKRQSAALGIMAAVRNVSSAPAQVAIVRRFVDQNLVRRAFLVKLLEEQGQQSAAFLELLIPRP